MYPARPINLQPTKQVACTLAIASLALWLTLAIPTHSARAEFKAGAVIVDVTPEEFPVLVNGGMYSRSYDKVNTPVQARALAFSDDKTTLVIMVVDSCMMPRPFLDEVKALATARCGIPSDRMLISATHTHTAPSCMGALGTDADPKYVAFLRLKLADAIVRSIEELRPAQVGFGVGDAGEYTALRRWVRRPDRIINDPFGNPTVRASMHAAKNWDDVTGPSGPEDPDLSILSVQTTDGKPLALLANFSMHYFGSKDISADYFGLFCDGLQSELGAERDMVAIMSHGCSGDIWKLDYAKPKGERNEDLSIADYATELRKIASSVYHKIDYKSDVNLAMAERRMTLKYRVPDLQRLQWAEQIVSEMGDRAPKTQTEVYAREQILLHEKQQTEIVVQAIRIGDIGIATTPNETYAITGLKIKGASPLQHNMVIELANGGDGYIPPPEQHLFGGYNTWAARSAGLEVTAEPKITEACIGLLEQVSERPRNEIAFGISSASAAIQSADPVAWWRLNEPMGPLAQDASGNRHDAIYEPYVTYFLEGPHSRQFCGKDETNRAAMFVGGRLQARLDELGERYSVSLWLWNGMPTDGREVTGWFFSRGQDRGLGIGSDHVGIGGSGGHAGQLIYLNGSSSGQVIAGKSDIPRWTWQHVVLVKDASNVRLYLNGNLEIDTELAVTASPLLSRLFLGGRSDNESNWEGRLDEIAVFDRALSPSEVASLTIAATD